MAHLQSDLREFIGLLNSLKVEYLVVGGHAVAFHGHTRFTGDIEFLIRATSENAERVLRALGALGFGSLGITASDLTEPGQVVQLGRPANRIEFSRRFPESTSTQRGRGALRPISMATR